MNMKSCSKCKVVQGSEMFYKEASSRDGFTSACKECTNKHKLEFYRSKKGLISKIYGNQLLSCKRRNSVAPTYSKKELAAWLESQELFHVLYDNWKRLDFQKSYVPSVDRKNDYVSYTLDNIQLMTWDENNNKGYNDRRDGVNTKVSKAVNQFSILGELITTYKSIKIASRTTGVHASSISDVCKGKYHQAGGFIWVYVNPSEGAVS